MIRRLAALCAASLSLTALGAAAGEPSVGADLRVTDCADQDEIVRIAHLELGTQAPPPGSPATVTAEIRCLADRAEMRVADEVTGKSLERAVDYGAQQGKGRSRLLALALAELVRASWVELVALPPPPLVPRVVAVVPEPVRDTIDQRTRAAVLSPARDRTSLWAFGAARGNFTGAGLMAGGGLAVEVPVYRFLAVGLDARYMHGQRALVLGATTIDTFDAAVQAQARARISRALSLEAGLGLRVGLVRVDGAPYDPTTAYGATLSAPWLGPELSVGLSLHPAAWLDLRLRLEAGTPAVGVHALTTDGDRVAFAGPWLGATAGAGASF